MERDLAYSAALSAASLAVVYLVYQLIKASAKRVMVHRSLSESRYLLVRRILFMAAMFVAVLSLTYIWGIEIRNLWVSITGLLAMVAIAFFAVWSLIGNILAGVLIFFTAPFKLNDTIELLPDGIKGRVLAINTFFTLLADDEGDYFHVPNSLFFQKYLKVYRRPKRKEGDKS